MHSTKLSGLAVDTEYVFHLVLKTSAGTFSSEKLKVQTHKMTDLSGITITPGHMPAALRESLLRDVEEIGAKIVDTVRIDTTHFVCTDGRGPAWEKAVENNIPVVVPDWVKGCKRDGRIVGVRGYYLNADPRLRSVGGGSNQPSPSQLQGGAPPLTSPRTEVTPPTPDRPTHDPERDAAPPPPPPKDHDERRETSPEASPSPEPEPKARTEEQKVRPEDLKPTADDSDDDSDDGGRSSINDKSVEAGLPTREKPPPPTAEEDDDDQASFQEVQL